VRRPSAWASGTIVRAALIAAVLAAGHIAAPAGLAADRTRLQGEAVQAPPAANPQLDGSGMITAWNALRSANCDRCHGKDYEGLAAPSIVAYARTQSREMFVRMVLDGDPPRGMPGYRGYPLVAENIDSIYEYFMGRAHGTIEPASRP